MTSSSVFCWQPRQQIATRHLVMCFFKSHVLIMQISERFKSGCHKKTACNSACVFPVFCSCNVSTPSKCFLNVRMDFWNIYIWLRVITNRPKNGWTSHSMTSRAPVLQQPLSFGNLWAIHSSNMATSCCGVQFGGSHALKFALSRGGNSKRYRKKDFAPKKAWTLWKSVRRSESKVELFFCKNPTELLNPQLSHGLANGLTVPPAIVPRFGFPVTMAFRGGAQRPPGWDPDRGIVRPWLGGRIHGVTPAETPWGRPWVHSHGSRPHGHCWFPC